MFRPERCQPSLQAEANENDWSPRKTTGRLRLAGGRPQLSAGIRAGSYAHECTNLSNRRSIQPLGASRLVSPISVQKFTCNVANWHSCRPSLPRSHRTIGVQKRATELVRPCPSILFGTVTARQWIISGLPGAMPTSPRRTQPCAPAFPRASPPGPATSAASSATSSPPSTTPSPTA